MYKHIITYRYYLTETATSNISAVKKIEIVTDERIYLDGPGIWKTKCRNFISTKTGINPSQVIDDSHFRIDYTGNVQSDINSNNSKQVSQEERDASYAATVAANRERREEKEAELERKSIRDERQRLIDIKEAKIKAEKIAKEKAERKQKANELRSQGKNFQAFLVEFKNVIIGASAVVVLTLFFFITTHNKEVNKEDAMKINSELELIEDSVKIYINNKNYDKALLLTNKLVHKSHDDMENMKFDSWNGYPKFDEYWTKKREEYKKIIFNKGSLNSEQTTVDKPKVKKTESELNQETPVEEDKFIYSKSDSINDQEGLDDEYKN